ncbi:unnamed protein product, partial [Gulo gulo]
MVFVLGRDHSKFFVTLKSGSDSSTSDRLLEAKTALRPEQPASGLPPPLPSTEGTCCPRSLKTGSFKNAGTLKRN